MTRTLKLRFQHGRLLSSEVDGAAGPTCMDETKKFLDGLGANPEDFKDIHKPEFDQSPTLQQQGQGEQ